MYSRILTVEKLADENISQPVFLRAPYLSNTTTHKLSYQWGVAAPKVTPEVKQVCRAVWILAAAINISSKMSLTSPDRTKNHATPKRPKLNRVRRGEVRETARKNILAAASVPSGAPVPKLEAEEGVRNIPSCDGGVDVRCLPI